MNDQPSQAELDAMLAYEVACAQIEALRVLRAICQDLSNPKEARLAATAILRYAPVTHHTPAAPSPHAAHQHPFTRDADATLDADLSGA